MKGRFGKLYRSIPHLPGSLKTDRKDGDVDPAMAGYFTVKTQQKGDIVIVSEKVDGTCVGVLKDAEGLVHALNRAGWPVTSSKWKHQHYFDLFVKENYRKFDDILGNGDRIMGEWMILSHGIRYPDIPCPWLVFEIFRNGAPIPTDEHYDYLKGAFGRVPIIYEGSAISVNDVWKITPPRGFCFADERPEGFVYRIERNGKQVGIAKWVRPDFQPGKYLSGMTGNGDIWNIPPEYLFRPGVLGA